MDDSLLQCLLHLSLLQVNIKPDMPGHTLISVYHQYPPNATPSTSTTFPSESQTTKDCIPPEPIPSTIQSDPIRPSLPPIEQPLPMSNNSNSMPMTMIDHGHGPSQMPSNRSLDVSGSSAASSSALNHSGSMVRSKPTAINEPLRSEYSGANVSNSSFKKPDRAFFATTPPLQQEQMNSTGKVPEAAADLAIKAEMEDLISNSLEKKNVAEAADDFVASENHVQQTEENEFLESDTGASSVVENDGEVKAEIELPPPTLTKAQSFSSVSF